MLTHTFLTEISRISWERSVYMSKFFQEEQMVYLHRAGASWGPATEDDFSAVRPSLWYINSWPAALTVPSFLANLHFADLHFLAGKAALGREQYVLAGAVFLAASARAEHRRVGQPAGIVFGNADVGKYKNQKWSPSDSPFFKHMHSSADNRSSHAHMYFKTMWAMGAECEIYLHMWSTAAKTLEFEYKVPLCLF